MTPFDPAVALRLITNNRLRVGQGGWATYRDLGGALAVTSDAPIAALNSISDFTATESHVESLLDLGFSLLRMFDRVPAVEVTPLDRPESVAEHLHRRGMAIKSHRSWMVFRGDAFGVAPGDISIRVAGPDDVITFGNLHGGGEAWVRRISKASMLDALLDPGNTFYMAYVDAHPVATLHLLADGTTAGIYAVGAMHSYRGRGIASAMISRAIRDARAAGCDAIGLSTDSDGPAERLYERLGFVRLFESQLWVEPERPVEQSKIRKRRLRKPRT